MAPNLRISLAQFDVKKGNPRANWIMAQEMIAEAQHQKAHVVVLPELWDVGYALEKGQSFASSLSGGLFSQVAALAKQHNLYVLGSMMEKRGLGVSNTVAVTSPNRGVMGAYRKIHLFPLMDEHKWLTPGEGAATFDLPWGRTGIAICYDLRFPELFRRYAVEGAIISFLPCQWPTIRIEHYRSLVKARAIENQMYMVAVNRTGADDYDEEIGVYGTEFGGHSMVVDPWGNTVIELGEGEGVYTVEVDLGTVEKIREQIPILRDRRPELYEY